MQLIIALGDIVVKYQNLHILILYFALIKNNTVDHQLFSTSVILREII